MEGPSVPSPIAQLRPADSAISWIYEEEAKLIHDYNHNNKAKGNSAKNSIDAVPFPFNRTSGLPYSADSNNNTADAVQLPVGMPYYNALCATWRAAQTGDNSQAPAFDEEMYDESQMYDWLDGAGDSMEMSPAVPLSYVIELLIPDWEDEGLYATAMERERRAQQLAAETTGA